MRTFIIVTLLLMGSRNRAPGAENDAAAIAHFEKQVRPLLLEKCHSCHSQASKKQRGGLLLDSRDAILKGGDTGPAIVPGKPDESLLIRAVRSSKGDLKMPPKDTLRPGQIRVLEEWIRLGAPYPQVSLTSSAANDPTSAVARQFWSFQPLQETSLPKVTNATWPQRPIDAFLVAEMEKRKLHPSPPADRRVLIRRASFDLLGLPPKPENVEAFAKDDRPEAYARLVDRLLASPHYGERWARYWMDLARYCDIPETWMKPRGQAWPYRDWVIEAFNHDLPFNQFVLRQLAADQLPGLDPKERAALGFLGMSPDYWKELQLDTEVIKSIVADEWEEKIETVSGTFLGLTTACARCHDHKYDPITMADYYALAGVIASVRQIDLPLLPDAEAAKVRKVEAEIQGLDEQIQSLKSSKAADAKTRLADMTARKAKLEADTPGYKSTTVRGVADGHVSVVSRGPNKTRLEYEDGVGHDIAMHTRGNPSRPGPVVPRRFLTVFSKENSKPFTQGSGRLELAKAIVGEGAPLTARVFVNRVWKHHFGRGLVETPSDFGTQGDRPSHPELLENLAARFVANGWSVKWLHREIMLSAAYQQASTPDAAMQAIDPDNRWLWRMNRRRLEVEAWRDSMLAVSGALQPDLGGPPQELAEESHHRRTIYGTVRRTDLTDLLRLHDFPNPLSHSATRLPTTTPLQQLFTLNSPMLRQQASALAKKLEMDVPAGGKERIARAYQLLFQRPPTESEARLALEFLGPAMKPDAWSRYCHVLLGSNEFLFID